MPQAMESEAFSLSSAPNVVRIGCYTDDHRFIIENTGIPMIDVINIKSNGQFGDYHHTHSDNMEIIDKETLQAVGQIILATVYKESNRDKF